MSVQDFIKKSILESGVFDSISITNAALGLFTALALKDLKDVLALDTQIFGKLVNAVTGRGRCHIFLLPCLTSRHRRRLLSCREWNCINYCSS